MASIIKIKRSSTASSVPESLQEGELAVNLFDRKLYVGNSAGVTAITADDATSTVKGVASFSSDNFSVTDGAVSIKDGGIVTAELADSAVTNAKLADNAVDSAQIVSGAIDTTHIGDAQVTNAKIASDAVTLGTQTTGNYVAGVSAGNNSIVVSGSGSENASVTVSLGDNIGANTSGKAATAGNADTATALETARTISLGGDLTGSASFDGTSDITISASVSDVVLGDNTTGNYVAGISGTANEIEVSGSGSEGASVTVGLPDDVTIGNNLTVSNDLSVAGDVTVDGNLTVEGALTYISSSTVNVDDSAIKLAANNAGDTVDVGMYGHYVDGVTSKYSGWFRDASDNGIIKFYTESQSEPTQTVDTNATGFALAQVDAIIDGGTY